MNKNETVTVKIEDFTKDGEGIGHVDGFTLFVKDAVPGDTVRAVITRPKKTYAYAKMTDIISPGSVRVRAVCPEARRCGGCRLQEVSYAAQLEWKRKRVCDNLARIGGLTGVPVRPCKGMEKPFRYRNKAQYPVRLAGGRLRAGFFAGRTHTLIPVDDCLLAPPEYAVIVRMVLDFAEKYSLSAYDETTGKGLIRHILIRKGFATGELMVCLIINADELPHADKLADALSGIPGMASICFNINKKRSNVILGDKIIPVRGNPWIEDVLEIPGETGLNKRKGNGTDDPAARKEAGSAGEGLRFRISPRSFYQVNPLQCVRLYMEALRAADLTGSETVYDLYCGIGTISLFLARYAKEVYGIEIVPDAIRDAKANAKRNGIENARFYVGAAEDLAGRGIQGLPVPHPKADVVVLDPPRKGCAESLIKTVIQMKPRRIVYVSCDDATLARDLGIFSRGGYRAEYAQPVDMFPQTAGVEVVAALTLTDGINHGEVL